MEVTGKLLETPMAGLRGRLSSEYACYLFALLGQYSWRDDVLNSKIAVFLKLPRQECWSPCALAQLR